MRLVIFVLISIALVCAGRADDAILYRRIRFNTALAGGHLSACSVQFQIAFDPRVPPRREDVIDGEIVFSRHAGQPSAAMTLRAFGDHTTKFTGVGRVSDVTLTNAGMVFPLQVQDSRADSAPQAVPPGQAAELLSAVEGGATLGLTLSDPARRFAFPFSLDEEGLGPASDDLARAGRAVFDDCMTALAQAPH